MAAQKDLFNLIKTDLVALTGIKHVALWNNQLANERQENPFLYPAIFIEFTNDNFNGLTNGVQQWDLLVTLHLCFESYKDEDINILDLKEQVFAAIHKKQYTNFASQMLRIDDEENFDHPNVQDYMQIYKTTIKDFGGDKRATTPATVTTLITPITITP